MNANWVGWLSLTLWIAVPVIAWLGRKWLVALVEKGVQHNFDIKIEALKGDLRRSEEQLKSELRDKEAEISLLRSSVLTGSAARKSLADKRQFEAVEKMWTAVNDLAGHKMIASVVAMLRLENIASKMSQHEQQQFLGIFEKWAPTKEYKNVARDERPFVPDLAWAYFSAYTVTIVTNTALFFALKAGLDNPQDAVNSEHLKKILLAALPHRAEFINSQKPKSYYFLLDELEELLLAELRKIVDGSEADQADAARARDVMDAVQKLNEKRAAQRVESAGLE